MTEGQRFYIKKSNIVLLFVVNCPVIFSPVPVNTEFSSAIVI